MALDGILKILSQNYLQQRNAFYKKSFHIIHGGICDDSRSLNYTRFLTRFRSLNFPSCSLRAT